MRLNRKIATSVLAVLIFSTLAFSFLMITSVEDVEAKPYHPCCETKIVLKIDKNGIEIRVEITDCANIIHWHWDWGHPFTCPSS